jgi:hypothetical protein
LISRVQICNEVKSLNFGATKMKEWFSVVALGIAGIFVPSTSAFGPGSLPQIYCDFDNLCKIENPLFGATPAPELRRSFSVFRAFSPLGGRSGRSHGPGVTSSPSATDSHLSQGRFSAPVRRFPWRLRSGRRA